MKLSILATACVATLAVASCSSHDDAALALGQKVAGYVQNNAVDSLKAVYPTADFDSLAFVLQIDTYDVKLDNTKTGDTIRVNLGDRAWIDVLPDQSGELKVVASKGLAAYPDYLATLATESGLIDENTPDLEKSRLMADKEYFAYLDTLGANSYTEFITFSFNPDKKSWKTNAAGEMTELIQSVKVTNNSHLTLAPEDYVIEYAMKTFGSADPEKFNFTGTLGGVALEPGQTAEVTIEEKGYVELAAVKFSPKISLNKYMAGHGFKPKGNEYEQYKAGK
ncbi:MAG: hypothetical protein NC111_04440 [Bacteroides sp.]|nr:hypothetical protein [Bacteroides sp.]MCM1413053.1 hypothetical protein [Bacteroides sp.]MCM1471759.1 hypothetical protein [Bacteroides sp.]